MSLYFEIGEVIKTNGTDTPDIVCRDKGSRCCDDCYFGDKPTHYCDSVACESSERPDGVDVIFQKIDEAKGGAE